MDTASGSEFPQLYLLVCVNRMDLDVRLFVFQCNGQGNDRPVADGTNILSKRRLNCHHLFVLIKRLFYSGSEGSSSKSSTLFTSCTKINVRRSLHLRGGPARQP
ncbi:hypothetical protein scyTo_0004937 [Scyliorhinus torazame]|uniref:Uncharacterized protein n=1 Tax=Scyliorhinus torazame TaxID=75743 RepID=A0A401NZH1_SCYTO|nr:hypothetical protein [Scyliorhinus torazame]